MSERVRHPRALAAFRAALYLATGVAALAFAAAAAGTLLLVAAVAAVVLLATGSVNLLAVGLVAGLVVAATACLVGVLAVAARRLDRTVTAADREPDPLARAKERYVEGEADETELERRLEGLLADDAPADRHATGAGVRESRTDRTRDRTDPSGDWTDRLREWRGRG